MTHVLVARLDNDGDVLLAGPGGPRRRRRRRPGDAARAARAGARRRGLLPGVDEVLVRRAAVDRRRARPVDRGDVDALRRRRWPRRALDRAADPRPPSTRARCRSRCCCGWPACRAIAAISGRLPRLAARRPPPRSPTTSTRSSARSSLVAALGYPLPPGDDGAAARSGAAGARVAPAGAYVVVHPGASVPARAWAPERHAALVAALRRRGPAVVVTGGPGETRADAPASPATAALDLGGATTLAELADVLARRRRASSSATRARAPRRRGRHARSSRSSPRPCPPSAGGRGACRTSCCTSTCRAPAAAHARARCLATLPGRRERRRRCSPPSERLAPAAGRSPA